MTPGFVQRALVILWPAFLMAGVMETLVFAVVDPAGLSWFGGPPIGWSAQAVYTVSFLIFWAVIAAASALTALLASPAGPRRTDAQLEGELEGDFDGELDREFGGESGGDGPATPTSDPPQRALSDRAAP